MVDEGRGPPEVGEVADGDVAGVGALGVELWQGGGAVGVEVGVAEVAVGEGVGAVLEPDDDGVDLADGAEEGVVDVVVDCVSGDEKADGCVDAMGQGYGVPGCLEGAGWSDWVVIGLRIGAFETTQSSLGMLCGSQFDEIGGEEMTGDKRIKKGAQENVIALIVMTTDADENTILQTVRGTGY